MSLVFYVRKYKIVRLGTIHKRLKSVKSVLFVDFRNAVADTKTSFVFYFVLFLLFGNSSYP